MIFQTAAAVAGGGTPHPLSGTAAGWVWALPLLPLLGFVLNGTLAILGSAKVGPADPSAGGHDGHDAAHGAPAGASEAGGGHDDVHAVVPQRHPYAGLVSVIGPLVLIAAFALACAICMAMVAAHPATPFIQRYFSWMPVGDLSIDAAFQLDQLSMVIVLVITGVGTLIHLFSVGYMRDDPGYPRYSRI
jgi:NADH-quinone oxidoreductase subunit L